MVRWLRKCGSVVSMTTLKMVMGVYPCGWSDSVLLQYKSTLFPQIILDKLLKLLPKLLILPLNSALLIYTVCHERSWFSCMCIIRILAGLINLKCTIGNNFVMLKVRPTCQQFELCQTSAYLTHVQSSVQHNHP